MSKTPFGLSRRLVHPLLSSIVLLIAPGIVFTQSLTAKQPAVTERSSPAAALKISDVAIDDRLKALENALQQQNKTLTEMRAIIADQQRLIESLSAKAPGSERGEQKDTATVATIAGPSSSPAPTTTQTPTVEDRVKKLEGQVLKFGPFRFSGDFRLRFDGIFRKADPTPPVGFAPLTHQQNARMRYRVRLNLDTDIDSRLSFHGQLSTGQVNNPLTGDQDFGATTAHHPFFISEAWIDFHPNKATQFQAGRVQEVFADNSRFLFDDDIRFNGFNEKYTFAFKPNGLKVSSLES